MHDFRTHVDVIAGNLASQRHDGEILESTDALNTLGVLFVGGNRTRCHQAADANDDGWVDISDPLMILARLLLGGRVRPFPGSDRCGTDPSDDHPGCESYSSCSGPAVVGLR